MKKVASVLSMASILALTSVTEGVVQATETHNYILETTEITPTTTSVALTWSQKGDWYEVRHDGKVIYKGKKNKFTHENLDADTPYAYEITLFDKKGNEIDKAIVNTYTLMDETTVSKKNGKKKNALSTVRVSTIVDRVDGKLKLNWDDIAEVQQYSVYKNGELLDEVTASEWVDNTVAKETKINYEIVSKRELDENRKQEIEKAIKEKNLNVTPKDKEDLFYEHFYLVKEVHTVEPTPRTVGAERIIPDASTQWTLRYQTFIPLDYAPNPWTDYLSAYAYFGGDGNRGWNATSSKYRTRTDVNVCFCDAGQSVGLNKSIGLTTGYDSKYVLVGSARESGNGINLENVQYPSSGKITFTLTHASGNPLVASPDIDYYYNATFYNTGKYTIVGEHDQAPSHEFYIVLPGTSTYKALMQDTHKGFDYLFPTWPNKSFSFSN